MASSFPALGTEMDWQFNAYDGGASYAAGTTVGELTLEEVMTTGSPSSHSDILSGASGTNITGGNFYAGDYTLSLWLDASSLSPSGESVLFAYSGGSFSGSLRTNAIAWNGADNTLKLGRGSLNTGTLAMSWGDSVTSSPLTLLDGLNNITIAVGSVTTGANNETSATVWLNGVNVGSLASYNSKMNGGNANTQMSYLVNPNLTYGNVLLTNRKLETSTEIATFALLPEPTTAALGLMALAGLATRRRRR